MENPHVFQISEEYCSYSIHVYHVWYIYLGLPLKNIKQLQVNIPVPWMVWGSYDLCVFFSSVIVCAISPAQQILFTGCSRRPSNQKLRFKNYLVDGFQYSFYFHPYYLGKWSNLTCAYFSKGVGSTPTSYGNNRASFETCPWLGSWFLAFDQWLHQHFITDKIISKICISKFGDHQRIYTKNQRLVTLGPDLFPFRDDVFFCIFFWFWPPSSDCLHRVRKHVASSNPSFGCHPLCSKNNQKINNPILGCPSKLVTS